MQNQPNTFQNNKFYYRQIITAQALAKLLKLPLDKVLVFLNQFGHLYVQDEILKTKDLFRLTNHFKIEFVNEIENEFANLYQLSPIQATDPARPPIVTIMGHVDHGKTTLLDYIRKTSVVASEKGSITQHIGAYQIICQNKPITFIDTPGHQAFTAIRARGANLTDIVVIVISGVEGIKAQTKEAIYHAQAANVKIIVALNKCDDPNFNSEPVKKALEAFDLVPEEWGGTTICVNISAKLGTNVDLLLNNILLLAEILELKANPTAHPLGVIIESYLDKGFGPMASVILQQGQLKKGDFMIAGEQFGKVRLLQNDQKENINLAKISQPVLIVGFQSVPQAGDLLAGVPTEKMAKELSTKYKLMHHDAVLQSQGQPLDLTTIIQNQSQTVLNLILRADNQSSLSAIKLLIQQLEQPSTIALKILAAQTGPVNDSDLELASASKAIVIVFNIPPSSLIKNKASQLKVQLFFYDLIYQIGDQLAALMTGLMPKQYTMVLIGKAKVLKTFDILSAQVTIAGCLVSEGKVKNNAMVKVIRNQKMLHETKIERLKHLQDTVKEVNAGSECGISLEKWNDLLAGDMLEFYEQQLVNA